MRNVRGKSNGQIWCKDCKEYHNPKMFHDGMCKLQFFKKTLENTYNVKVSDGKDTDTEKSEKDST